MTVNETNYTDQDRGDFIYQGGDGAILNLTNCRKGKTVNFVVTLVVYRI